MLAQNIYYQEEKKHASSRLTALVIITFFSFIFYEQSSGELSAKLLFVSLLLSGLTLISMLHYYIVIRKPNSIVVFRKNLLIFLDLAILTFFIALFEKEGLFLLPLYILIVMRNGLSFGIEYFYSSIVLAGISWVLLLIYSPYWKEHNDIIATFAMTTLLLPLFYIKFITRVHQKNNELSNILTTTEYDANYDTLTSIPNRKMYKEEIYSSLKKREFFALLFIDLNKFKAINDNYGHHIGDVVLQEVSKRLSMAIDNDDFLARLGGDEFVIITKRKKVFLKKFIEKIEQEVIGKHTAEGVTVPIELSIGISMYPDDSRDEMMLSKYADDAMYVAKKKKDTYHQFYAELEDKSL
jgi:diguanylate cyclase (GGDEF)-like protein